MKPFGYTKERDSAFHNKYFFLRKEKTLKLVKISSMGTSKKIKILDVGCGNAPISSNLIGRLREVHGIDISFLDLKEASQKGVITIRGDLTKNFPLKNNVFDCIIATEIIEHVFDTDRFLLEIKRILKPGGCLIISTPNLVSLRSRLGTLMGRLPAHVEYRTTEGNAGHIRGYNIGAFKSHLEERDFEIIELTTSGIAIPIVHILSKIPDFLISLGEAIIVEAKNIKY